MIIPLILIAVLLMNSHISFASEISTTEVAAENAIKLYIKDLTTGEDDIIEIEERLDAEVMQGSAFSPTISENSIEPYTIIGSDDRMRIPPKLMDRYPYCCIGVVIATLFDGTEVQGTGFLVGPDDVITAAHVLYDLVHGPVTEAVFYPAVNGPLVGTTIGNTYGYLGWTTDSQLNDYVNIPGYPSDKPAYEMWAATGQISYIKEKTMTYTIDTAPGNSGGPVLYLYGKYQNCVAAIHCAGGQSAINHGKKVDATLANVFYNLRFD